MNRDEAEKCLQVARRRVKRTPVEQRREAACPAAEFGGQHMHRLGQLRLLDGHFEEGGNQCAQERQPDRERLGVVPLCLGMNDTYVRLAVAPTQLAQQVRLADAGLARDEAQRGLSRCKQGLDAIGEMPRLHLARTHERRHLLDPRLKVLPAVKRQLCRRRPRRLHGRRGYCRSSSRS